MTVFSRFDIFGAFVNNAVNSGAAFKFWDSTMNLNVQVIRWDGYSGIITSDGPIPEIDFKNLVFAGSFSTSTRNFGIL